MQKDIMWVSQIWLKLEVGRDMSYRIASDQVVVQLRCKTNFIEAIVTEPVIHAVAKPGAIVNHIQRTLPQIETLGGCTDLMNVDMTMKEKICDTSMKEKKHNTQCNNKDGYSYQQYFALAN